MRRIALALLLASTLAWTQEHGAPAGAHGQPAESPAQANQAATAPGHSPADPSQHQSGTEHAQQAADHGEGHDGAMPNEIWWKWANFGILAIVLGWLIGKHAGPFFKARTASIQQGIAEARQMKADADARAAAIEAQLDSLKAEVESLRSGAAEEMQAESARLQAETETQLAKIQARSEAEIAAAAKTASQELKAHAANLAVLLAQEQLRTRITQDTQDRLLQSFMQDLRTVQDGKGSQN